MGSVCVGAVRGAPGLDGLGAASQYSDRLFQSSIGGFMGSSKYEYQIVTHHTREFQIRFRRPGSESEWNKIYVTFPTLDDAKAEVLSQIIADDFVPEVVA